METIHNFIHLLRDSMLNFWIGFVFFLIAAWIRSFIQMGFTILVAPVAYAKVSSFTILGYHYQRVNDKFVYVKKNPIPTVSAQLVYNKDKYPDVPAEKLDKGDISAMIISSIGTCIVSAGLGALVIALSKDLSGILLLIVVATAIGLIFNGILSVIICFITLHKLKTSLSGYLQNAIRKVRSGTPYANLDLKSADELPYKNIANFEHIMYFKLYFAYLEARGELDKLAKEVANVKTYISKVNFNINHILAYMSLVYYHCYYDVNPDEAMHYMNPIYQYLAKDTDANTYRVLGFYELAVKKNPDLAYDYANKAHKAVDNFSLGDERERERVYIDNLFKAIDEYVK